MFGYKSKSQIVTARIQERHSLGVAESAGRHKQQYKKSKEEERRASHEVGGVVAAPWIRIGTVPVPSLQGFIPQAVIGSIVLT